MLETNGERIPQPSQRQVLRLPGIVLQQDIDISVDYAFELLDPTVLGNPALTREILADGYVPDIYIWEG